MSSLITNATIQIRKDTAGNWTSNNPTPAAGELCLETDTTSMKIGDGSTAWISLPYRLTLHFIAEADRPSSNVLNNGTATSWADVDFGAYVPTGVKALLLKCTSIWVGDGAKDYNRYVLRKNGSSVTNQIQLNSIYDELTNMTAGKSKTTISQLIIDCDTDGIIEYQTYAGGAAAGSLSLNIIGYYI